MVSGEFAVLRGRLFEFSHSKHHKDLMVLTLPNAELLGFIY